MPNPQTITSTKDKLAVHFMSDYSVSGNGFRLEWRIQGCGGLLSKVSKLQFDFVINIKDNNIFIQSSANILNNYLIGKWEFQFS